MRTMIGGIVCATETIHISLIHLFLLCICTMCDCHSTCMTLCMCDAEGRIISYITYN